jgi:hypothetical protein
MRSRTRSHLRTLRSIAVAALFLSLSSCADWDEWDDEYGPAPASSVSSTPAPAAQEILLSPKDCALGTWGDVTGDALYSSPPNGMILADWQRILTTVYQANDRIAQACQQGRVVAVGPSDAPAYKIK